MLAYLEFLAIAGGLNDTGDQCLGNLVLYGVIVYGARDAVG